MSPVKDDVVRVQLQHPGMDFSGAEMSGEVPDPAAFMGGFEKQK
jgi:hypothetical protein